MRTISRYFRLTADNKFTKDTDQVKLEVLSVNRAISVGNVDLLKRKGRRVYRMKCFLLSQSRTKVH